MWLINQIILQTIITYFSNCFDLALFGEDEGNFKEKNSLIQWILNSSSANCIYECFCVSHTFSPMFRMERKLSSEVVTEYNYS